MIIGNLPLKTARHYMPEFVKIGNGTCTNFIILTVLFPIFFYRGPLERDFELQRISSLKIKAIFLPTLISIFSCTYNIINLSYCAIYAVAVYNIHSNKKIF